MGQIAGKQQQTERIAPGQGQESVWDYPRPPRIEPSTRHIQVAFNGIVIADSRRTLRVLETSHPPVYYLPPGDVRLEHLAPMIRTTFCEYKGVAHYYRLVAGDAVQPSVAWTFRDPAPGYEAIKDYVAFYPGRVEACYVDGERIQAQEGDFYGGWITCDIVGPFKGGRGTWGW